MKQNQCFMVHVRVERCRAAQLGQLASHPNEKNTEEMLYRLGLVAYRDACSALFLVTHVHAQRQGTITNLNRRYILKWLVFPCHLSFPVCQFRGFMGYSGCWTMDRKRDFVISTSQLEVMVSKMFFLYWPFLLSGMVRFPIDYIISLSDGLRPPPSCRSILSFLNWHDIDNCWWWPFSPA